MLLRTWKRRNQPSPESFGKLYPLLRYSIMAMQQHREVYMSRTIICHVGTSLLNCSATKINDPFGHVRNDSGFVDMKKFLPQLEANYDQIRNDAVEKFSRSITHEWSDTSREASQHRGASPAEIASLAIMSPPLTLGPQDRVVLAHSDTLQGKLCSDVVEAALAIDAGPGFPQCCAESEKIEGLKVEPGTRGDPEKTRASFIRDGLSSYAIIVGKEFDKFEQRPLEPDGSRHQLVLNVTGGYKGLIPMARDLSLILTGFAQSNGGYLVDISLAYLFETSPQSIVYDAFSLRINRHQIPFDAIERAQDSKYGIQLDELEAGDPIHYFEEMSEIPGGYKPSPIGSLMLSLKKYITT
jgi:hypothetical protein